jgi:hypothetical protein
MTQTNDPELERHSKRLLDVAAHSLDADTVARLRAARARAWQRAETDTGAPARRRWWLPVGGVAIAGIVLAVAGALWLAAPGGIPATGFEDTELLASKESPEFYAELEFYQWLAARTDAT